MLAAGGRVCGGPLEDPMHRPLTPPARPQIETVLDEATAELAKMDFVPLVSTVEAAFKIKKAVPLHTSLLVQCR